MGVLFNKQPQEARLKTTVCDQQNKRRFQVKNYIPKICLLDIIGKFVLEVSRM